MKIFETKNIKEIKKLIKIIDNYLSEIFLINDQNHN